MQHAIAELTLQDGKFEARVLETVKGDLTKVGLRLLEVGQLHYDHYKRTMKDSSLLGFYVYHNGSGDSLVVCPVLSDKALFYDKGLPLDGQPIEI